MGDDLLLTNKYVADSNLDSSDTRIFDKLMNAKKFAKTSYSNNNPEFTDDIETNRETNTTINENSIAFEQFIKLADIDKKKKIKKTILNIDSRNRSSTYTYDSQDVNYNVTKPLSFINNDSHFTVLTGEDNFVKDLSIYKQIIIRDIDEEETNNVGIKKVDFEFDFKKGTPIFNIIEFRYIDKNGNEFSNNSLYDPSTEQFKFNKLILPIPFNIDSSEIQNGTAGEGIKISFITNVDISYPSPSHYFINLGKTFSNIYSIRLVSSEIPNTSYTFNENLIETNFGQFKLTTKQNNKLRWINKTDRVHILNNNVMKASIFHKNMPILPTLSTPKDYHLENFKKLKKLCNVNLKTDVIVKVASSTNIDLSDTSLAQIEGYTLVDQDYIIVKNQLNLSENGLYQITINDASLTWEKKTTDTFLFFSDSGETFNYIYHVDSCNQSVQPINNYKYYEIEKVNSIYTFSEIDYINNRRRINSLLYLSSISNKSSSNYVDGNYIGLIKKNNNNLIGLSQSNLNLDKTIYTFNTNLIHEISQDQRSFYMFRGEITDKTDNTTYCKCTFTTKLGEGLSKPVITLNLDFKFINSINNDFIQKYVDSGLIELPTKIVFNSLIGSDFYRYSFILHDVNPITATTDYNKSYQLSLTSINGYYNTNKVPFYGYTDSISMTIFNKLDSDIIFNYMKLKPDYWTLLKNYYLTSEICMIPNVNKNIKITDKYERTYLIKEPDDRKFQIEYKTYHRFTFTNTPTFKQVKRSDSNNKVLDIYFIDSESNSISDISNIAREYSYLRINNLLFRIDTSKVVKYDTNTTYYSITMIDDINNTFEIDPVINLSFQKETNKEIQYLYLDNLIDYSGSILRMFDVKHNYIDFFISEKTISQNANRFEVRFKNAEGKLDMTGDNIYFYLFDEYNSIFFRDYIGLYLTTKFDNSEYTSTGQLKIDNILDAFDYTSDSNEYNSNYHIVKFVHANVFENTIKSNVVDITSHDIITLSDKNIQDGINEISFAKEFVTTETTNGEYINPKINADSNNIPSLFDLNHNLESYSMINDIKEAVKFPVYELNIASGKYSADSIVKYMLGALDNLKSRIYDYSKGIFYTDSSFNKFIDLNNEFGINQESKFVISVNKSVNSILFKQYKKIFDAHKNTSVVKGKIAYYNEGFPYIYFNVPQISLVNNSLIFLAGGGSLANVSGSITRGEKTAIIPPNYKIRVRQLLPLPRSDAVKNTQNMFTREDYVDVTDSEIYNKYVDFVNRAVNDKNTKDVSVNYIVKKIFGIGESDYIDFKDLSENRIKYLAEEYSDKNIAANSHNIVTNDLKKAYLNNYGVNVNYDEVEGFNNQKSQVYTSNKTGIEYYGQAMINGYRNEEGYKEYLNPDDEMPNEYGDVEPSGFETTFIQNEIFMRLSDVNVTHKDNITGRFTNVAEFTDRYGNIEADYDLFSQNYSNFKIGDIIIGLDSNTIGIILPYDYTYNTLPNLDLITLGLGAYLMNKTIFDSGSFFEKYTSISNTDTKWREKSKNFIKNINSWQIEKNKTSRGFYIFSSITPNESKLTGAKLSNFQIYLPRFFKFIEDDDTALSKFGLKNSENNSKFNYFKTNYESNHEVSIKRSFFNTARNNDIYSDYIIFETKSTDNFNVNDRVYIEDHNVIMKNSDFTRERFFNVSLIESFSSYISKLETIYNNTVVNYNGLSGVGIIHDDGKNNDDNQYLVDDEYKYSDSQGNSSAKAIAIISAKVKKITINSRGRGYTGIPSVTFGTTHLESGGKAASITIPSNQITNGRIDISTSNEIVISEANQGLGYNNIPEVIIENSSIKPEIIIESVDSSGGITAVVNSSNNTIISPSNPAGFGYTESPNIIAPTSGVTATAAVGITGIGTIEYRKIISDDLPVINFVNDGVITFSDPNDANGVAAEAFTKVNGGNVTVEIINNGAGYTVNENITFQYLGNATEHNLSDYFSYEIDAIGTILIGNNGSNYNSVYPPEVTITDEGGGTGAVVIAIVNATSNNITGYSIVNGGRGYSNLTTITIDPPRALFKTSIDDDGRINGLDILYGGKDYTINSKLEITEPKITATATLSETNDPINGITNIEYKSDALSSITFVNNGNIKFSDPNDADGIEAEAAEAFTRIDNQGNITVEIINNGAGYAVNENITFQYADDTSTDYNLSDYFDYQIDEIGKKARVNIINPGTGYTSNTELVNISGNNAGAKVDNTISNGEVTEIIITNRGASTTVPTVVFTEPLSGEKATATAVMFGNKLLRIDIVNPGSGYTSPPNISFEGNTTVTAICKISNGRIKQSTIRNLLAGSISDLTISYNSPSKQATATASISGSVTKIDVYQGGSGYKNVPSVTIDLPSLPNSDGVLEKSTFICQLEEDSVKTGIFQSTDGLTGGTGYSEPPNVIIDNPDVSKKITIPFKNKHIYRYFNQELDEYSKNYYLCYKSAPSKANEFTIDMSGNDINNITTKDNISLLPDLLSSFNTKNMIIITINQISYLNTGTAVYKAVEPSKQFVGVEDTNYYINIKTYRLPLSISEIGTFDSSHLSSSSKFIKSYSTLGIFERLLDEHINRIYENMSYNLVKSAELYRKYSYNVFRNRIIKLKVCPIDDKGFCFEPLNSDGSLATETNIANRSVRGYSKKLFPYHEYDIIKTYDRSEFGTNVDIIGVPYKSYRRPFQLLKNTEQTSKAFLPGMGIYIIENETAESGSKINNEHYNVTSTSKDIPLYYSEYTYQTKFIGYVLDTSIHNKQEYNRNYRLNSENFSKVENSKSIHSEYYIYMLIDPNITTSGEIDQLFNLLNKDNINIVFDASADKDYITEPLTEKGYVTSKNEYYVNSNTNNVKTKSDDKPYSIAKNTYGHRTFLNEQDELLFFEDESYTTPIEPESTDAFINLTASSITIRKARLNNTLPYYNFQKRIACATITERPVAYETKNNINSRKLFVAGDYDYFYKDYMENKSVMRYEPILDNKNIDYMNKHNVIIENAVNSNFKSNNFKETDCHSNYLDSDKSIYESTYNVNNKVPEFEQIDGSKPILRFNNGEDIILVDALKLKFSYEEGENNYSTLRGRGDTKLGTPNTHVKILTGSILPKLYINHNRLFDNSLNKFIDNTTILEYDYDSNLERLTYNTILGKYKPDKINIVGNNSFDYDLNEENDTGSTYCKIFIENIDNDKITIRNRFDDDFSIASLKDYIVVFSTNISCKNSKLPIDDTNNCELRKIISAIKVQTNSIEITLNFGISSHKNNIEDSSMMAFILYPTVKLSSNMTYDPADKLYKFEINHIDYPHYDKINKHDCLTLDWGIQRNIVTNSFTPYKLKTENDSNYKKLYTSGMYRVEYILNDTDNNKLIIGIKHPKILYQKDTNVIIMKNTLGTTNDSRQSSIPHNFISTQPFTINNEWYTRIFYKGNSFNIGKHYDNKFKNKKVLPNIDNNYIHGGDPLFNTNYANTIFIGGMKGIKIPFTDIDNSDKPLLFTKPIEDNYYDVNPVLREDFTTNNNTSPIITPIYGAFETNIDSIQDDNKLNSININDNKFRFIPESSVESKYPSIVIKGLYLGYGGFIEERTNQDTINAIINKDRGLAIKKITKINNKFFIYLQLSSTYNNLFPESNIDENKNLINQSSRQNYLDYETNLRLLDDIFKNDTNRLEYEENISIYGTGGKMIRKIIKNPYDLNPDNYIYMVIPNLNHIESVQNNSIKGAFAKILLPGESTKTLFSSFVAGTKVFYNNLFNNLTELEVTFITNEGHLFDFNGSEHSFSIEITEIIDKFEYINPRFGNIEI